MSVNENFLDAMKMMATDSVEKAGYDKTIQAQVVSCEDATIGKYRCRYQDAIIYAYASNADVTFSNGSYVYILVPGNDMKKQKTILGTTKKLGINYISQAEGDQAYDIIGNNCIVSNNKFYLDSANQKYKYVLYQYGGANEIDLDDTALNQYIQRSTSLIVGATFKTSIPQQRQYRGHYGITYNLRFLDNTSNKDVIRSYTVDEDNMVDNPYKLIYETRQYQIFDIDGVNFKRVESIEIFNQDFPGATGTTTEGKLSNGDIQITALELFGAARMTDAEINGVAISFFTPQGTFFTDFSTSTSYKTITAQVRVKGKLASAAQKIPFYWGVENVGILPSSEYYNKHLGRGWKCLNDKNVILEGSKMNDPVIEWVPSKDTYVLKFEEATARDNKLKVAIVYDGNTVTKEINIQNLNASIPNLTIESSGGTKFYYDIGHPTLTCKVNDGEPDGYHYYWAYEDNAGIFNQLPQTEDLNIQYATAVQKLDNLKTAIDNGTKFANAEATNLNDAETAVKSFDFIQRVQGNKVYDVQINNITSFGTFKCSVYNNNDIYLGTASITLTNTLQGESLYSLVINNGSAVYQYNENGVAPNNKSLDVQQQIQGLSFTVYDNLGQPINSDIIANTKNCKIRWQFPIKDSMLVDQKENEPNSGTDAEQNYKYYDNRTNLVYGIAQKYDIKKQRNQIILTVDYKGMNLTAETQFTFAKQGEPGTNGTEYLVKIVPNTKMDNPPLWPMITKAGSSYYLNYGINTFASQQTIGISSGYQLFKVQLWHSGQLVWEGTSAKGGPQDLSEVRWDMLSNQYNKNVKDDSAFVISDALNGSIRYTGDHLASGFTTPLANIVKCSITWQGKTYYATMPITTAWTSNQKYRVRLKDYTGFRYVVYTSDGMSPQYDSSHPFEFICEEKIDGIWEDVSTVSGAHAITYDYSNTQKGPIAIGNYKSTLDGTPENSNLLKILTGDAYRDGCKKNQWQARPVSKYDGVCVNEAICCLYRQGGVIVGRINVPIHYLLNKYGMANINAWDGNSVQVDEDGGFILSPQMGAGEKDSSNNFTGVLMGTVRNAGKKEPDIGLLGYSKGDRTFFLNSKNGSALFGKTGSGQIAIDPSQQRALIYSGKFWSKYNEDGLPADYSIDNEKKEGLLIDLSKPEIRYGSGNFRVDEKGKLYAKGGGTIAGWSIGWLGIYSNNTEENGRLTLKAGEWNENKTEVVGPGKIFSYSHAQINNTGTGFYLGKDGISFGAKTKITSDGIMYLGPGAVEKGGSQSGTFWTINGDSSRAYMAYGGNLKWDQAAAADADDKTAKVYLGTDGISLGKKFSVTNDGRLKTYSGVIGGWSIGKSSISAKNISISSDGAIQTIDYDSNAKKGWKIDNNGDAYFKSGNIGGWTIEPDKLSAGSMKINSDGSISGGSDYVWSIGKMGKASFAHIIANTGGEIGGWKISATQLKGGDVTLGSDGSLSGSNWKITSAGAAEFTKLSGKIDKDGTLTASGMTMGGSGGGGSSINPNTVACTGTPDIKQGLTKGLYDQYKAKFDTIYAREAIFTDAYIRGKLKLGNSTAQWITVLTGIRTLQASVSGQTLTIRLHLTYGHAVGVKGNYDDVYKSESTATLPTSSSEPSN